MIFLRLILEIQVISCLKFESWHQRWLEIMFFLILKIIFIWNFDVIRSILLIFFNDKYVHFLNAEPIIDKSVWPIYLGTKRNYPLMCLTHNYLFFLIEELIKQFLIVWLLNLNSLSEFRLSFQQLMRRKYKSLTYFKLYWDIFFFENKKLNLMLINISVAASSETYYCIIIFLLE